VLAEGATPEDLAGLARRFGIQRMHVQPQAAAALLADRGRAGAFPSGLNLFTTGARIPQALRLDLQAALGVGVHVQYGTTEVGMVSLAGPADHAGHPDAVGRVFAGIDVAIVDGDGRALPAGAEGLLRFRSSGAVRGYLDDPAADARYFPDGWFQPGDVGRVMPDGALRIAGRQDDMMTLGVIKIFPAEIEAVAEGFPGLRAALGQPGRDPDAGLRGGRGLRCRGAAGAVPRAAWPAGTAQGGGPGRAAAQRRGQGAAARPAAAGRAAALTRRSPAGWARPACLPGPRRGIASRACRGWCASAHCPANEQPDLP
jgi:acyl-CoA synthetase (AMP-forming)/AMP-acid ligase II